eukprot:1421459-Amphidinium_carterae.1
MVKKRATFHSRRDNDVGMSSRPCSAVLRTFIQCATVSVSRVRLAQLRHRPRGLGLRSHATVRQWKPQWTVLALERGY